MNSGKTFNDPAAESCREIVTRAYYGMLESGATTYIALAAAARVYKYHNPDQTTGDAQCRVEAWLNLQTLH